MLMIVFSVLLFWVWLLERRVDEMKTKNLIPFSLLHELEQN